MIEPTLMGYLGSMSEPKHRGGRHMSTATEVQARLRLRSVQRRAVRPAWAPIAGVLAGAGWGSNQFTPMLLVYHARLGLSTTTLEALFGAYAAGLIPGLLLVGRWSDRHGR